jgi:hypothetical protein
VATLRGLVSQDKNLQVSQSEVAYADYSKGFAKLIKYLRVRPSGVAYAYHVC